MSSSKKSKSPSKEDSLPSSSEKVQYEKSSSRPDIVRELSASPSHGLKKSLLRPLETHSNTPPDARNTWSGSASIRPERAPGGQPDTNAKETGEQGAAFDKRLSAISERSDGHSVLKKPVHPNSASQDGQVTLRTTYAEIVYQDKLAKLAACSCTLTVQKASGGSPGDWDLIMSRFYMQIEANLAGKRIGVLYSDHAEEHEFKEKCKSPQNLGWTDSEVDIWVCAQPKTSDRGKLTLAVESISIHEAHTN